MLLLEPPISFSAESDSKLFHIGLCIMVGVVKLSIIHCLSLLGCHTGFLEFALMYSLFICIRY